MVSEKGEDLMYEDLTFRTDMNRKGVLEGSRAVCLATTEAQRVFS